jgi:hypothetical protein
MAVQVSPFVRCDEDPARRLEAKQCVCPHIDVTHQGRVIGWSYVIGIGGGRRVCDLCGAREVMERSGKFRRSSVQGETQ